MHDDARRTRVGKAVPAAGPLLPPVELLHGETRAAQHVGQLGQVTPTPGHDTGRRVLGVERIVGITIGQPLDGLSVRVLRHPPRLHAVLVRSGTLAHLHLHSTSRVLLVSAELPQSSRPCDALLDGGQAPGLPHLDVTASSHDVHVLPLNPLRVPQLDRAGGQTVATRASVPAHFDDRNAPRIAQIAPDGDCDVVSLRLLLQRVPPGRARAREQRWPNERC